MKAIFRRFGNGQRLPKSVFLSFGALWIPALVGWRLATPGSPLHRWRPLIPIVLLTPLLLVTDLQRVWFLAFPFVLPLALLGIRSWLPGGAQTA